MDQPSRAAASHRELPSRRMLVLDLDGTLLRSDKSMDVETEALVHSLCENEQWTVVFATARPPRATFPLLGGLAKLAWIVCYNGGMIFRCGELADSTLIPEQTLRNIHTRLLDIAPDLSFGFERDDQLYVTGSFEHHFPARFYEERPPSALPYSATPKILVDVPSTEDSLRLKTLIPKECEAVLTDGGSLLQVMAKGANKGSAIEGLLSTCGVNRSKCLCFGDDINDIPLFQACGRGVAMGNACPELKAIATDQTSSNDEQGVYRFLRHFLAAD